MEREDDLKSKERFTGLAEDYAKGRPGYCDEAINFVIKHCGLKFGDVIADIGCGTGISSRTFSKHGLKVIGIEPNADMRAQAQLANEKLKDLDSLPIYQEGSAEHTGLLNNYCNAIVVAQAYHWFDKQRASEEFIRILKPGGWVILLWNLRTESDSFTTAYGDLMRKCDEVYAKMESSQFAAGEEFLKTSLLIEKGKFIFSNQQIMNQETFYQRVRSVSYVPKDKEMQDSLMSQLEEIYNKYQNDGLVTLKYDLHLYVGCRP